MANRVLSVTRLSADRALPCVSMCSIGSHSPAVLGAWRRLSLEGVSWEASGGWAVVLALPALAPRSHLTSLDVCSLSSTLGGRARCSFMLPPLLVLHLLVLHLLVLHLLVLEEEEAMRRVLRTARHSPENAGSPPGRPWVCGHDRGHHTDLGQPLWTSPRPGTGGLCWEGCLFPPGHSSPVL